MSVTSISFLQHFLFLSILFREYTSLFASMPRACVKYLALNSSFMLILRLCSKYDLYRNTATDVEKPAFSLHLISFLHSSLIWAAIAQSWLSSLLESLSAASFVIASASGIISPRCCVAWSSRLRMLTVLLSRSSAPTTKMKL